MSLLLLLLPLSSAAKADKREDWRGHERSEREDGKVSLLLLLLLLLRLLLLPLPLSSARSPQSSVA